MEDSITRPPSLAFKGEYVSETCGNSDDSADALIDLLAPPLLNVTVVVAPFSTVDSFLPTLHEMRGRDRLFSPE